MVFLQNVDKCYARPLCTQVIKISIHSLTMLGNGIVCNSVFPHGLLKIKRNKENLEGTIFKPFLPYYYEQENNKNSNN